MRISDPVVGKSPLKSGSNIQLHPASVLEGSQEIVHDGQTSSFLFEGSEFAVVGFISGASEVMSAGGHWMHRR